MINRVLILVGAVVLGACASHRTSLMPAPASGPAAAVDVRAVEAVLRGWYDASARHDSSAYAGVMLPDFEIIEDTTRFDKTTLTRLVVAGFARGTDRAELSDLHTVIAGDAAWTSFRNTEVFTPLGRAPQAARRYLETAIFHRVDGQWRLARYHATRINRPPPR